MSEMPEGLTETERALWAMAFLRQDEGRPLLQTVAALRAKLAEKEAEVVRLAGALESLMYAVTGLYGEYKARAQFGPAWDEARAALEGEAD